MKIKKIDMYNWGPISHCSYEPEKTGNNICAVLGPNGSGKSRFLDGIRYGLVGDVALENRYTIKVDGKNNSPQKSLVSSVLESNGVTHQFGRLRTFSKNGTEVQAFNLDQQRVSENKLVQCLKKEYHLNLFSSRFVVSTKVFQELTPMDLADLLGEYIPDTLTKDVVLEFVARDSAFTSLEKSIQDKILNFIGEYIKTDFELCQKNRYYQFFFDRRREKNREFNAVKYSMSIDSHNRRPTVKKEDIEKLLYDLSVEEQKNKEAYNLQKLYQERIAAADKQKKDLEQLMQEYEKYSNFKPVEDPDLIGRLRSKLETLSEEINQLQSEIRLLESNNELLKQMMTALDSNMCPFSKQFNISFICKTDKTEIITPAKQQSKENEHAIKAKSKLAAEKQKLFEETRMELVKAEEQNKGMFIKSNLEKQIQFIKDNPVAVPEKPVFVDVQTINAKRNEAYRVLQSWNDYEKLISDQKKAAELAVDSKAFDYLVKAFDSKGLISKQSMDLYIHTFENKLNEISSEFLTGFEIKLVNEKGVHILLKRGTQLLNFNNLSNGEKTNIIFIILMLLTQLNNTKIIILDEVTVLDADTLKSLVDMILRHKEQFDHVFMAGVDYDTVRLIFTHQDIDLIDSRNLNK